MTTANAGANDPPVSILDHEAFAVKHIPDLGHDVKEFKTSHWKLQGWKKLKRKLTSPEFDCGGHRWRILLFPAGNSNYPPTGSVSVYLDHVGPNTREDQHVCTQFALVISNPHDPTIYTVSHAHHRFTAKERDWGFTRFSELRKLSQRQPGHNRPTIEGDSAMVSAYVRVLEDPTGTLLYDSIDYDSKRATGYIGLKNLGATGYMNTVLQCLFHVHYFRKSVYKIPTEDQHPTKSIPLALQRVFYLLQTSDQPVDTTELAKSFGWGPVDLLIPRDVQEFNRVLQHELESKMKGTPAEGAIAKLFVGKMKRLIKCVNIDHESSRIEEFNDIRLRVKGMKTLYDCFRDYVAVKTLAGEHGYQTGEFGLQDARAAVAFRALPPVLCLQLKRYEYDTQRDTIVRIDDHFEFPSEVDLDEFLDEAADRTEPWRYRLHSVLVHSGDTHGGHNYALIKSDLYTRWLKFDDDQVTPATDREVPERSYGGGPLGVVPQTQRDWPMAMKKYTNANVLVYIREAAIGEVMAPVTEEDTPPHLRRRLRAESAGMGAKGRKGGVGEPHLFLAAKIVTDEIFFRHEGFDLAAFDKRSSPLSPLPTFHVPKKMTYSAFKSTVAQHFSYPKSQIRLWVLVTRQNETVRPDTHITEDDPSLTVEGIRNNLPKRRGDLWLYLDILPDPSKGIRLSCIETFMLFLKHFDTTTQSLLGIGKVHMPRASKVSDLIPIINERMKWASGTSLKFHEEIKPGMIEPMKLKYTFSQSEVVDGDIICFQAEISDQEARDLESQGLYSDLQRFYNFLQHRAVKSDTGEEPSVGLRSPGGTRT